MNDKVAGLANGDFKLIARVLPDRKKPVLMLENTATGENIVIGQLRDIGRWNEALDKLNRGDRSKA